MSDKKILENMAGKKVEIVEVYSDGGDVRGVVIYMDDGSKIEILPSSYNYGPQELVVYE